VDATLASSSTTSIKGSSTSATNSRKMGYIRRTCTERGLPFVHIGESTGARLPDAMGSKGMGQLLGNDISQFRRTRETPWAAAALDTSFGSSAWQCCCADFSVMKKGSIMAVSSPRLVSMAIGQKVDLEELGGWRAPGRPASSITRDTAPGNGVDPPVPSYMPSHHRELSPVAAVPEGSGETRIGCRKSCREVTQVYNMKKVVEIIRRNSFFRSRRGSAGRIVGRAARRPQRRHHRQQSRRRRRSSPERPAADRRFTVLCFNIPLIRMMDTPGFVVGLDAERRGAPGHIMNCERHVPDDHAADHRHRAQSVQPPTL
jgi:acetyl-CoA carboxylase carboxyltransferase component